MQLIDRSRIVIKSGRQRQEFDSAKMLDLQTSIENEGLFHAPVMRQEGQETVLVAGETRIRVMDDIWMMGGTFRYNGEEVPSGMVPYVTLGQLSELEAEEAELSENLHRKDLTWQELAAAHDRLHKLRQKQAAAKPRIVETTITSESDPDLNEVVTKSVPHTLADTAKELFGRSDGDYQNILRQEIIVAQHLDNPEVAKAKTMKEAFKILKTQEQTAKNTALAQSVGATFNSSMHTALHGNCLSLMDGFPGEFDVILTDPPYGMGADQFGDGGGKLTGIEHHYDDSYESWKSLMQQWVKLTWIVTKPQAHLYAFCDIDRFHELKAMLEAVGWDVFRTPLIVYKINSGRVPRPEHGPRRQYEIVLYAIKGGKRINSILPDVIPSQADDNMTHGAQKPVAVYQNLLQRSVQPGDSVLDCFSGSGTIFPAAHLLKCKATGMEQEAAYYGMGLKRLEELK